ncbi:MAG: asparaginase [Saprospiraceae bacterium]|nr:MAG: asparaginase [Saprospiraceae bacterium]
MVTRRKFFRNTFLASFAMGTGLTSCSQSAQSEDQKDNQPSTDFGTPPPVLPTVIATWKNEKAVAKAMQVIESGGRALDAVEAGVKETEADPEDQSVGYGGRPDRDGIVTLDACIMDEKGNAGSVCFLQNIKHPISVARKVMEVTPHVMLCGEGALAFALEQGFQEEDLLTETSRQEWEEWKKDSKYEPKANIERHDTIGLLAIDQQGHISGACTTSGMAYKLHGRVGDSPIIGAGLYVDDEVGGACATGVGEMVMKTLGSFLVVELMRLGKSPQEACEEAVNRIIKKYKDQMTPEFQIGYLAINKRGEHGAYAVVEGFNFILQKGDKSREFESPFAI